MTDGRVYTLEDEIDVLHEDLGKARRRVNDLESAPKEGRMGDPLEWEDSLANARRRVLVLEAEVHEARAQQVAADEGFGSWDVFAA